MWYTFIPGHIANGPRFLHTKQLILRPALEHLFKEQQHDRQYTAERSMEARLQEAMLCEVALQCVLSAKTLVDFLAVQMESYNFTCWWYNISCKWHHRKAETFLILFNRFVHLRKYNLNGSSLCIQQCWYFGRVNLDQLGTLSKIPVLLHRDEPHRQKMCSALAEGRKAFADKK